MRRRALPLAAAFLAAIPAARGGGAKVDPSPYAEPQGALSGEVAIREPQGAGAIDLDPGCEGRSVEAPPHRGLCLTAQRDDLGFGAELDHQKVHASDEALEVTASGGWSSPTATTR